MNENEARESEEVDVTPFTGKPDKDLPRSVKNGVQDDEAEGAASSPDRHAGESAAPTTPVVEGEPVGGQELAPTAPTEEVAE